VEQGREAEDLDELGAEAGEHEVGEEDISLHFSGDCLYRSWIRQAEL
jgi:hypothetical protein